NGEQEEERDAVHRAERHAPPPHRGRRERHLRIELENENREVRGAERAREQRVRQQPQETHIAILPEGLRPSDSPTRSLARRFAGALRSRGSLAALARIEWCAPRKCILR